MPFVAAYAAAAVAWAVLAWGVVRCPLSVARAPLHDRHAPARTTDTGQRTTLATQPATSFAHVVLIALLLRALLFFVEPRLSGDVYRYLWDGQVLASGTNPYLFSPRELGAPATINHPEIRTIYPPHAQLLFLLFRPLLVWRLLLIGCDLIVLWLLRGTPKLALLYATFPLLLFEGTWSAHVDAAVAMFVGVALLRDSGVAAAMAVGVKVIPIVAVPALLLRSGRRSRFALGFALALLVPVVPFVVSGPVMPGMRDYATRWIFNSPFYDLVFAVVDRLPLKELWTAHPLRFELISDVVYRHLYSDFVTRAVLGVTALALIAVYRRSVAASIGILLLCSPTIHPWYWLALLPAALMERSGWVWVALCAPFSYLLYQGAPAWVVYGLCYGVPAGICAVRYRERWDL